MPYTIDRGIKVSKDDLLPNPWNPNKTNHRTQEAIRESIQEYGQVLELLVRPDPDRPGKYQILDGEHRYNVLPDMVYVNIIYGLPDAHAKKLTVVLNETRGKADKIELVQLLAEINGELGEENLGIALPYETDEIREMLEMAEVDWDKFDTEFDPDPEPKSKPEPRNNPNQTQSNGAGGDRSTDEDEDEDGDGDGDEDEDEGTSSGQSTPSAGGEYREPEYAGAYNANQSTDGYTVVHMKVTELQFDVLDSRRAELEEAGELSNDNWIAWGQVIASFLPQYETVPDSSEV